jgi:hypothetical protein
LAFHAGPFGNGRPQSINCLILETVSITPQINPMNMILGDASTMPEMIHPCHHGNHNTTQRGLSAIPEAQSIVTDSYTRSAVCTQLCLRRLTLIVRTKSSSLISIDDELLRAQRDNHYTSMNCFGGEGRKGSLHIRRKSPCNDNKNESLETL